MSLLSKYGEQYRSNLRLALPVVAAQLGQIVVQLADNIMVGRYGGEDALPLAAVSFGAAASFLFFITCLGMTLGLTPLVGELYARGEERHAASYLRHSAVLYVVLGLLSTLLQLAAAPLLYRMGQPVEVVDMAMPYYRLLALSMAPVMLFGACKQFLEGIGNTTVAMMIIIACNLLNIILNWVFIYGNLGAAEMGVAGAGLATLLARVAMPLIAIAVFRLRSDFRRWWDLSLECAHGLRAAVKGYADLLRMGAPIAVQMFLESAAFVVTGIMTGWFDTVAIGANQIAITIGNCTFMIAVAVSAAATIRVSHCYGRRDWNEMRLAVKASMHIVAAWEMTVIIMLWLLNRAIPLVFTSNPEVADLTSTLLLCVAMYQILDGLQCVGIGVLRGFQDVRIIPVISFLAYMVLNLPVGYLFGFTFGLGPKGLYVGYIFGLGMSALLVLLRIKRKIRNFSNL